MVVIGFSLTCIFKLLVGGGPVLAQAFVFTIELVLLLVDDAVEVDDEEAETSAASAPVDGAVDIDFDNDDGAGPSLFVDREAVGSADAAGVDDLVLKRCDSAPADNLELVLLAPKLAVVVLRVISVDILAIFVTDCVVLVAFELWVLMAGCTVSWFFLSCFLLRCCWVVTERFS